MYEQKQNLHTGLYRTEFEHDNCGIGAIVNIKGRKSHNTVADALKMVKQVMELEFYYRFHISFSPKSVNLSASFYVLREIMVWECFSSRRMN